MQQVSKIKVLLAEDDLSLGYVIKDNLVDAGYDVVYAPTARRLSTNSIRMNSASVCWMS
jgi:DNA-binding response OmpR family regulator